MVEKIIEKLKIPLEKTPSCFELFGNTSMSSIPLTMVTCKREEFENSKLHHVTCGFGSGLSWASGYIVTDCIVCPELVEI